MLPEDYMNPVQQDYYPAAYPPCCREVLDHIFMPACYRIFSPIKGARWGRGHYLGLVWNKLTCQWTSGRPISAKVNAGINLLSHPEAEKGIHMSRLYLLLDELTQGKSHRHYCNMCVKNFDGISSWGRSDEASIEISGELLLPRKSLNSNHSDWKVYPLTPERRTQAIFFHYPQSGYPFIHQPARLPLHLAATSRVCSLAKTLVTGSTASRR